MYPELVPIFVCGREGLSPGLSMGGQRFSKELFQHNQQKCCPVTAGDKSLNILVDAQAPDGSWDEKG